MNNKKSNTKRGENLTVREQEIFNLLLEGNSSKEIAFKLKISPRTVDYHRNSIYNKLDVHNYQELIAKRPSINKKHEEAESSAQTDSTSMNFTANQYLKTNKLSKFLIPAAIFILIISIIPLWYFTIKAYFSKSPEETPAFIDRTSDTSACVFSEIPLRVNRWTSFYGHGENWSSTNEIKLSDFFTGEIKNILKTDQEISYIKLSGNIDTTLKNAYISFHWVVKDGYWGSGEYLFNWLSLGCSSIFSDPDFNFKKVAPDEFSKFEVIFPIKYNKYNDYLNAFDLPPGEVFLTVNEMINNVHTSYKPHNVDFGLVPENIPDGAVMATIKNLIIEPYDPNL